MPRLAIAPEVLRDLGALAEDTRREAVTALRHFLMNTTSAPHPERVRNTRDARVATLRLTDRHRGVVVRQRDVFWMVTVLPEADAWSYAQRHRFAVNAAIGIAEIWDDEAFEGVEPSLRRAAESTEMRLFAPFCDTDLLTLGIDPAFLPLLRLVTSEVTLDALEPLLPGSQHAPLAALAQGGSIAEAWRALDSCAATPPIGEIDAGDLAAALERTPDRAVFVPDPEALDRVLAAPGWRTFLSPVQHRLVSHLGHQGPILVVGGAGTGKTLVALHRAARLARQSGGRVLVVTFSQAVAADAAARLRLLADGDERVLDRIEVGNVERLAHRIVTEAEGRPPPLVGGSDLAVLWREASEISGDLHGPAFLMREWEQVILAQNLCSLREYLAAERPGRSVELDYQERTAVWKAIEYVTGRLRATGRRTLLQLAAEACTLLGRTTGDLLGDDAPRREPYRHIVVDEAQDLHPAQWRLLRAAVPPGPDDLFIVGDPHQRVFDTRVALSTLGIKAETFRLSVSYRPPGEILSWCLRVRGGGPADGLVDGATSLAGLRPARQGGRPDVREYTSHEAELAGLANHVREWLDEGVPPGRIAVAARTSELVREARAALAGGGVDVRVTPFHRLKGLEFQRVALVGVSEGVVPAPDALTPADEDPTARAHDLQRERGLLYMACTRAGERLYVSYSGRASPFLPP
ncbi:UvrD-helicase domain-containing protein [Sphaerisporangium sp. TRM90804]|uniref:UvrD-helicase domain-containing protein n=1 Tax=Sphaerisporangium sp. TRM90804 TaxID=3031113 RepID=UPI00244BEC2D|nr:UvrD-helicase domain-containing protein [Sphaerisporangium sp. TRM90804]MDH2429892.1 UvrD-helicase domain-containing protein [Sphaerisporangium sp. TRM90804]